MAEVAMNNDNEKENERIAEYNMLAWLMYTPLDKIPEVPNNIKNEDNTKLGLQILKLIEEKKIVISGMDTDGMLITGLVEPAF